MQVFFLVELCAYLGIYNLPGRRICMQGRGRDSIPGRLLPQMRRRDRHRPGCFLLLLLLCHHCAPPALCRCCFSSLPSALCCYFCSLRTENPQSPSPTSPYIDSGTIGIKSRTRRTTKTSGELYLFLILLLLRCVVGLSAIFR